MKRMKFFAAITLAVLLVVEGEAQTWNVPSAGSSTATYIGTTSANDVIINAGGTTLERLRILGSGTNAGFVGIGTTSPVSLLHLSAPTSSVLTLTSTATYPTVGSVGINFSTGGSINQANTYACGTGTLHITHSSNTPGIHLTGTGINFSSNSTYDCGLVVSAKYKFDGSLASPSVLISDNNVPVLALPTGFSLGVKGKSYFGDKVGIGTTAPANKLDVSGGTVIGSTYSGTNTAPTDGLLVQGNLGIGLTSPSYKLDVSGAANFTGDGGATDRNILLKLTNIYNSGSSALNEPSIIFDNGQSPAMGNVSWSVSAQVQNNQTGVCDYFRIGRYTNSGTPTFSEFFRVLCNGYVGIGGIPSYTFESFGDIAYTGSLVHVSDKRYKKNIALLSNSLAKIKSLNGVSYQFDRDKFPEMKFNDKNQLGFIAQDLQKIFPELVTADEKGYLAVNYTGLIPVLVEAIKEQQKQIETLQTKIGEQESYNLRMGSANISSTGDIKLFQNSPNPFDQTTIIAYTLPESVKAASIIIFDMQGTQIKKIDNLSRGNSQVLINGGELNSGMYLYSLIADGVEIDTKRMILTK